MFGDTLKKLRKAKGITQEQLAQIIGVERSSIGKYEGKDGVIPSDDVKIRIAEYFGVSVDYLLGKETPNPNAPLTGYELLPLDEKQIIDLFRKLTNEGKSKAFDYLMLLQHEYREEDKKTHA